MISYPRKRLKFGVIRIRLRDIFTVMGLLVAIFLIGGSHAFALSIYWTENGARFYPISRANQNGSAIQGLLMFPTVRTPGDITLDVASGKMYWTDWSTRQINRANLDGTSVETLYVPMFGSLWGITLDTVAGKMYWTEPSNTNTLGYAIRRANLDGSNVEGLITRGLIQPYNIVLDTTNQKMYWTEHAPGMIMRSNLDGTDIEIVRKFPVGFGVGIAIDPENNKVYFVEQDYSPPIHIGRICRSNLDGANFEVLVEKLKNPIDIALDKAQGKMYWTDGDAGKIQRANLDGSYVQDIINGLSNPLGIALDLTSPTITLTPPVAINSLWSMHTLHALVEDQNGNPIKGVTITFTVTGENSQTGIAVTNDLGIATWSYAGENVGMDTIIVSSSSAISNSVTKEWTLVGTSGKTTGWGGYGNTNFFNFNIFSNGKYPIGIFSYSDRTKGINFWGNLITNLMVFPDKKKAVFKGNIITDGLTGYKFIIYLYDNGNPGTSDKFKINIYNSVNILVYSSNGTLFAGNIQIYP